MKRFILHNIAWFILSGALVVFILLLWSIDPGYYLVQSGSSLELKKSIEVINERQDYGNIFLTTVSKNTANGLTIVYGFFHPYIELRPREQVIPPDMDRDEYNELMQQRMEDSQDTARIVALETLTYEVEFAGEGVEVVELEEDSPAENHLIKGDVIKKAENEEIYLADQLVSQVENYPVGEKISLIVKRDEQLIEKNISTAEHPEKSGKSYLGIYIQTKNWEPVLPVTINFDTGRIGGPSAGLMFVLEIMNQLTEEDLTAGKKIAGTGAVSLDGSINPVGGVEHKVRAAEQEGADYFLVPGDNYSEARESARAIDVIEINNVEQAQEFLDTL